MCQWPIRSEAPDPQHESQPALDFRARREILRKGWPPPCHQPKLQRIKLVLRKGPPMCKKYIWSIFTLQINFDSTSDWFRLGELALNIQIRRPTIHSTWQGIRPKCGKPPSLESQPWNMAWKNPGWLFSSVQHDQELSWNNCAATIFWVPNTYHGHL